MTERRENPAIPTTVQFVALTLACPRCGTPVALLGRLELTSDHRVGHPCCVCKACGEAADLVLQPGRGMRG